MPISAGALPFSDDAMADGQEEATIHDYDDDDGLMGASAIGCGSLLFDLLLVADAWCFTKKADVHHYFL